LELQPSITLDFANRRTTILAPTTTWITQIGAASAVFDLARF
jgi:hypothetical protein